MFSSIISPLFSLVTVFLDLLQSFVAVFRFGLGRNSFERVYHAKLLSGAGKAVVGAQTPAQPQINCYFSSGHEGIYQDDRSFEKFAPENVSQVAPPVLVFLHGGCWVASDRNDAAGVHRNFCRALAMKGFPVVNANYRLCSKGDKHGSASVSIEDQLEDVAALCAYLVSQDVFSCQRQGLLFVGHSAGGHLALQAALSGQLQEWENVIRGVYVLSGVYDLVDFYEKAGFFLRNLAFSRMQEGQTSLERLRNLSPKYTKNSKAPVQSMNSASKSSLTGIGSLRCALRLVHGANDGFLLVQAQECVLNLQAWKNRASLRIFERHDHFSVLAANQRNTEDLVLNDLAEFAIDAAHSFVSGKAV